MVMRNIALASLLVLHFQFHKFKSGSRRRHEYVHVRPASGGAMKFIYLKNRKYKRTIIKKRLLWLWQPENSAADSQ
jgi:hypothetical protein